MKIAQVVCAYPPYPGGIGQVAARFGKLLAADHDLTTFTLTPLSGPKNNEEPNLVYLNPKIRAGHGGLTISLLWRLRKYEAIFLHYPFFGADLIIYLFLLVNPQKKLFIHYHMDTENLDFRFKFLSWPSHLSRKKLFTRATKISAASLDYLSHSQIAPLLKRWPEKFITLPFGLDTEAYRPKLPDENDELTAKGKEIVDFVNHNFIKRGRVNLLFVGGLDSAHYFKGLNILLPALTKLRLKNWQLTIVGDGDRRADYEKQGAELNLSRHLKFVGRLSEEELIRTYQNSDLFILPSINSHEAFGLVLTEAMACGVPVIASDLPGVRTVFRPEIDGLLVKPHDRDDLAAKIAALIGNEPRRRAYGQAARAYALRNYSLETTKRLLKKMFS
jgi:glycosyltransferase involved in cell wall biosynthesis